MTSYSVMKAGPRFSVIATWPGSLYEHSAKVTTLDDGEKAFELAVALTDLSEAAWDVEVWLDAGPSIPPAMAQLVAALRNTEVEVPPIVLPSTGYRHTGTWSFEQLSNRLTDGQYTLNSLTRAQRLTVADEIALDAWHREQLMSSKSLTFPSDSRVHQACQVTRVEEYGSIGPLPEGAAGRLRMFYAERLGIRERWGARAQILRMEQLVAACLKAGGRARNSVDPFGASCVLASTPGQINIDDIPFWITPDDTDPAYEDLPSPHLPLQIYRDSKVVASIDAADDDGFAAALGEWTREIPYTATTVDFAS